MGLELEQSFAGQKRVRELKAKQNRKYGKYKHDSTVGMHISRRTGMCMCLDTCCQDEGGCKCKNCRCRKGEYNHGEVIPDAGTFQGEKESEDWEEQSEV
jgi:hypothetical protein